MNVKMLTGNIDNDSCVINKTLSNGRNIIFLIDETSLELHEYIEKLNLEEMTYYYRLRIAKNLSFEGYIADKTDKRQVSNLYSALKIIKISDSHNITLIINKSSNFLHIIQQFIYLDIKINIEFQSFDNLINNIDLCKLNEVSSEINISVLATKKSGKSTFVNCIIDKDISPEGLLPTITNCHYIAHTEKNYCVNYDQVKINFSSPVETKKYLFDLFKQNVSLSDIYVKYPITGNLNRFFYDNKINIIDTPGSDFSLRKDFKDKAMQTIKYADIILFIIDYEKHFQTSEIEYLDEIMCNIVETNKDKFLIFLINKIDSLLHNPYHKRSIIMVTDFIRSKLINKNYNNVITFPVSAYFHYRYLKIDANRLCNEFSSDMNQCIKCSNTKNNNCGVSNAEIKIATQKIEDLKDILMVENATIEDLKNFGSIEKFIFYLNGTIIKKIRADRLNKK